MLPSTARAGDIVEVMKKGHSYFGTFGKLLITGGEVVRVNIFGKDVDIPSDCLILKARQGSKTHAILIEEIESRAPNNLVVEDYNDLINLAIDLQDFEWANELIKRKNKKRSRG